MFKGVYTALVTPMHQDGSLDEKSLKKLVEYQIDAGISGLVAMGTTGECATFPDNDHCAIVEKVIGFAKGRVPVIAGCSSNDTVHLVSLAQEMEKLDIAGIMAVTPYYNKPNAEGLYHHYAALAKAVKSNIILYNVPSRTGISISIDVVARLAKEFKNIVALKDAVAGDVTRTLDVHLAAGEDFCMLSGEDETTPAGYALGMAGTISVTANVAPKLMMDCYNAFQNNQQAEFLRLCRLLHPLHRELFISPNPSMPKTALYEMGVIENDMVRLPLVPADIGKKDELARILGKLDLLQNLDLLDAL